MRNRDLCHFDKVNAVVCDPGSYTFRVGLARHREPNVEIATTVGVPAGALDPGFRPDGRISYSASAQYDVDVTSLCVPREGEFTRPSGGFWEGDGVNVVRAV